MGLGDGNEYVGRMTFVRERARLPMQGRIRPGGGDCLYTPMAIKTMLFDIEMCVRLSCDGIVAGGLRPNGDVDAAAAGQCVQAAGHLGATFHRAIDVCRDPIMALEVVIGLGYERVLTSGRQPRALDGIERIAAMWRQAAGRIGIMAGGGISVADVAALKQQAGVREFHASASRPLPSCTAFRAEPGPDMVAGAWCSQPPLAHAPAPHPALD